MDEPPRNPLACGALGRYDRAAVARIAAALPAAPSEVHADRRSCLWLDRQPLRWRSGLAQGLAWSERYPAPDPAGVRSWEAAATRLDACGLALGARRRAVHSSVSGVAPVYWIDHGDATYFASRIDALVRGLELRLDVDWKAWAAILTMRLPLGERTPFRQIRRLRQFTLLERGPGGGEPTVRPWPWAQVEPSRDLGIAADRVTGALLEAMRPLRASGAAVLLSGGLDSRVLLGLAHDAGVPLRALTAVADDGIGWEAGLAEKAARAADADFESFAIADPGEYRRLWLDHLEGSDFQFVLGAFVMPMGPRLEELGLPALDGLAFDVLAVRGGRFYTPEMLDPPDGYDAGVGLWQSLRAKTMQGAAERALQGPYARALLRSSRRQFRREAAPFRGLRNQALLTQYSTRMLRGVATVPGQTMGRHANVFTPCASDRVAPAILGLDPSEKRERRLYEAVFDRIASPAARSPTVADSTRPRAVPHARRTGFSPPMVAFYARSLREGPLAPVLGRKLAAGLRDGTLGEAIHGMALHRAAMAVTAFHSWAERYDSQLRPIDPAALLEEEVEP